jgi:hypothetical protein
VDQGPSTPTKTGPAGSQKRVAEGSPLTPSKPPPTKPRTLRGSGTTNLESHGNSENHGGNHWQKQNHQRISLANWRQSEAPVNNSKAIQTPGSPLLPSSPPVKYSQHDRSSTPVRSNIFCGPPAYVSSSHAIPSSPPVLISWNVESIASPTPQPKSQIPQLKEVPHLFELQPPPVSILRNVERIASPTPQPGSQIPQLEEVHDLFESQSPPVSTSRNVERIASPTPQPRSQIPQLKKVPYLFQSQEPSRQPLGTRDWLRRHAVDGVYSSPDRQAPHVNCPLDQIPTLSQEATLVERIKFVNQCIKNAGFKHVSDFTVALMTVDFKTSIGKKGSHECTMIQYHEWSAGFEDTMKRLDEFIYSRRRNSTWNTRLESYNRAVVKAATTVLNLEFIRYGTRSDPRRCDQAAGKRDKAKTKPSYLQIEASEVTPEFLASNVVEDVTVQFQKNTPLLWYLFGTLTRNRSSDQRLVDSQKKKQHDYHIQTMALSMLFYSFSRSLRRMQTWFGCYLHASGARNHELRLFQQYGISIGEKGIEVVVQTLADRQRDKLKQVGLNIVHNGLNCVYDNLNVHQKVAQQRGDSQDTQYNGICGFVLPIPGRQPLLRRDTLIPQHIDVKPRIFFRNRELPLYSKILQCRQIELTIQHTLLDPASRIKVNVNGVEKPYIESDIRWKFNPLENATNCPNPSRVLPYDESVPQEKWSLKTVEAEELSNTGTISWLMHVLKDQLGIKEGDIDDFLQIVIGDLGTVKAIHAAKRLRSEDKADLEKLQWVFPLFGLFHLRKAFIELIIKLFHQPGCEDFAHLDKIIKLKNFHSFNNGKCPHFKKAEDLILLAYRSYIVAWFMRRFPHPNSKASSTEKRNHAARELYLLGKNVVQNEIIKELYNDLFSHSARYQRNRACDNGAKWTQQDQAGQMLTTIGLYIELRETEKYGRSGKIPNLLELLLPWFAGTSASLYTREIVSMMLLKKATTSHTFETIIDSLFVRAKGKWFIAADTACEQEVRINKEVYKAKGGTFRFENLLRHTALIAGTLYDCKMAVMNGHIDPEKVETRGRHYDPSMDRDIVSVADLIDHHKILHKEKPLQTISRADPYQIGIVKLQRYDVRAVKAYMFDMDFDESDDFTIGINPDFTMDDIGATPNDPDIEREDDEEDIEDPAEVLKNARLQIQEELGSSVCRGGV